MHQREQVSTRFAEPPQAFVFDVPFESPFTKCHFGWILHLIIQVFSKISRKNLAKSTTLVLKLHAAKVRRQV